MFFYFCIVSCSIIFTFYFIYIFGNIFLVFVDTRMTDEELTGIDKHGIEIETEGKKKSFDYFGSCDHFNRIFSISVGVLGAYL